MRSTIVCRLWVMADWCGRDKGGIYSQDIEYGEVSVGAPPPASLVAPRKPFASLFGSIRLRFFDQPASQINDPAALDFDFKFAIH